MAKEIFRDLIISIRANKGKVFGGIIGFIIAILVLTIGFFKTFFIVFCTGIGIFLGNQNNLEIKIKEIVEKIFRSSNRN